MTIQVEQVDVILASWLFCPPNYIYSFYMTIQVEQVDVILVGKDIASVFWHWPWSIHINLLYMWRNQYSIASKWDVMSSYVIKLPEFQIFQKLEFWLVDFSAAEFKKILPEYLESEIGIGILLLMGVPEIGTENWNSQPSSRIAFTCGFLTLVGLPFMPYVLHRAQKWSLNLLPLLYIKYQQCWYLLNQSCTLGYWFMQTTY
jgi:hypothetical protein